MCSRGCWRLRCCCSHSSTLAELFAAAWRTPVVDAGDGDRGLLAPLAVAMLPLPPLALAKLLYPLAMATLFTLSGMTASTSSALATAFWLVPRRWPCRCRWRWRCCRGRRRLGEAVVSEAVDVLLLPPPMKARLFAPFATALSWVSRPGCRRWRCCSHPAHGDVPGTGPRRTGRGAHLNLGTTPLVEMHIVLAGEAGPAVTATSRLAPASDDNATGRPQKIRVHGVLLRTPACAHWTRSDIREGTQIPMSSAQGPGP